MRGLIIINAYLNAKEYLSQVNRLCEEFAALNVQVDVYRNGAFAVSVDENVHTELKKYDFCVYLDKDKYVLQGLEKCGLPLFNKRSAIEACDDKMTTYLTLAGCGVPLPLTLPGILCYDRNVAVPSSVYDKIQSTLGYPLIVKESYGSRGTGVYLARSREELEKVGERLKCTPHLFQKYIAESSGQDVRVIVIGGKPIGAILRKSKDDFRSNVALGGEAIPYALSPDDTKLCEKVAKILNLDYCGIDLLITENGQKLVCEVNSNAFFDGFEKATGINVAKEYAEYISCRCQPSGASSAMKNEE